MQRDEEQEMTGWRKRQVGDMAREAKLPEAWISDTGVLKWSDLERFAELVRADEREALIEIVDMHGGSVEIVAAIRARSNT